MGFIDSVVFMLRLAKLNGADMNGVDTHFNKSKQVARSLEADRPKTCQTLRNHKSHYRVLQRRLFGTATFSVK